MAFTKQDVESRLERDLRPFLMPLTQVKVEADDEGVLKSVTLTNAGITFTIYGDAWTWE